MLKKLLLLVVILLAALLAYASTKPDTFRVQREATIQAPPTRIFALLNDFHAWEAWSPWQKLDPAMKQTHGGAAAGVGAIYAWEGNSDVGKGRMELTASTPPSRLTIQLDFLEPFEAHNTTEFLLEPNGAGANVTWVMHGPSPFLSKVMSVFVDMDAMIGKDFEQGLANLRAVAEK